MCCWVLHDRQYVNKNEFGGYQTDAGLVTNGERDAITVLPAFDLPLLRKARRIGIVST